MRKFKEVLRLKYALKLKHRQIGKSLSISPSSVSRLVNDAKAHGITWLLPEGMCDLKLEELVYGKESKSQNQYAAPDWQKLAKELQRKGVTKQLLWEEYRQQNVANAYSYSQFCHYFRKWFKKQDVSMRQIHRGGEKLFVDYAGQTMPIIDPVTGDVRKAQIFIAVLGASNFTYAEASYSQNLPDWIMAHVRAFNYIGGIPEIIVPDNLRSAVSKACRYEPDLNPTYQQLAVHYGCTVIPARPYRPKDKSKAEVGVQIVERKILARLRDNRFHSLGELNKAIRDLLEELNDQPFQKLPGTRRSRFIEIDKPALQPLPNKSYQYTEVTMDRVRKDYHIEYQGHYYSVPYDLIGKKVDLHACGNTIEIYYLSKRIVTHVKNNVAGLHTTLIDHMPESHRKYLQCTPKELCQKATKIGSSVEQVILNVLQKRMHPERSGRLCLGILALAKQYGKERLEKACQRALLFESPTRNSIQSILQKGLDHIDLEDTSISTVIEHENVRGGTYYQ